MAKIPKNPKIFHITHINNLDKIIVDKVLWSDAKRLERGVDSETVGMPQIKRRRLEELEVKCHSGTMVGEYTPFYFCPRSIMLYLLYQGNHQDVTYHGGQGPILHLQADLGTVTKWADENDMQWAFTNGNAGARYTSFYNRLEDIDKINWQAIEAQDWKDADIREPKQAEFLMYKSFPWELIEKIGVYNDRTKEQVIEILGNDGSLEVCIEKNWYY